MVGGYELEAPIGTGMSGTVWRARSTGPVPRVVALKRAAGRRGLHATEARERLRAEAALLAELDHPHIVSVLDVLDDGDGVAIVMPLASGRSLCALLDERLTLSAGEVVAVVGPVADALASAHRRGLVHGDVKPANILFTSDGEPLLSDFGAARLLPTASTDPVAGTAPYVDPALLDGSPPTPSSDLYALGVMCYEALLGTQPYSGTDEEILAAADRGDHHLLTDISTVPAPLAEAVEQAISRRPEDRHSGLEDFAEGLRASVDPASVQLPGTATGAAVAGNRADAGRHGTRVFGPRPLRPASEPSHSGSRSAAAIVLLCVLALGLAGAARLRDDRPAARPRTPRVTSPSRRSCATFPELNAPPGAQRFSVDLDGDGCTAPVAWDGQVLSARFEASERRPRYYEVGSRGDILLFGDWDCDRAQTPALYRPARGEVVYVNSFGPQVGDKTYAERVDRNLPKRGAPRVTQGPKGCQVVQVGRPRR